MSTMSFKPPQLTFSPLPYPQTQGSAQLTHAGYTVLASANGPIDPATRSQQQPEECTLEVNLRENAGAGGPRERNVERLLGRTLKPLIDVRAHPRTIVQVTLQVLRTPRDAESTTPVGQAESAVEILPALVNASVAALLNANVPMTGVAVAVGVVTPAIADEDEDVEMSESTPRIVSDDKALEDVALGAAVHAFAWTGKGEMLLAVSEGACEMDVWEEAAGLAQETCCGKGKNDEGMVGWLRNELAAELNRTRRWKQNSEEG